MTISKLKKEALALLEKGIIIDELDRSSQYTVVYFREAEDQKAFKMHLSQQGYVVDTSNKPFGDESSKKTMLGVVIKENKDLLAEQIASVRHIRTEAEAAAQLGL